MSLKDTMPPLIRAALALGFAGVTGYIFIAEGEAPDALVGITGMIVGYYFAKTV